MQPALFSFEAVNLHRDGVVLLSEVNGSIDEGRATALVGPSGSGKTTLLRMLNRLEEPTSGVLRFRGQDVRTYEVHELRRRIGLVGQQPVLLSSTVRGEVAFASPELTDDGVRHLLNRVGFEALNLDRTTADLSGGERQRLALARALAVEPEVLLLDEPTSSLDRRSAASIDDVVRSLISGGLSVVLVSHDLARAAALTDDALVLDHGRLVDRGDPKQIRYLNEPTEDE